MIGEENDDNDGDEEEGEEEEEKKWSRDREILKTATGRLVYQAAALVQGGVGAAAATVAVAEAAAVAVTAKEVIVRHSMWTPRART